MREQRERKRPPHLSDEEKIDRAARLWQMVKVDGLALAHAGRLENLTGPAVAHILKRMEANGGAYIPGRPGPKTPRAYHDRNERIYERVVLKGETLRAVAKDESISYERVAQIVRRAARRKFGNGVLSGSGTLVGRARHLERVMPRSSRSARSASNDED